MYSFSSFRFFLLTMMRCAPQKLENTRLQLLFDAIFSLTWCQIHSPIAIIFILSNTEIVFTLKDSTVNKVLEKKYNPWKALEVYIDWSSNILIIVLWLFIAYLLFNTCIRAILFLKCIKMSLKVLKFHTKRGVGTLGPCFQLCLLWCW